MKNKERIYELQEEIEQLKGSIIMLMNLLGIDEGYIDVIRKKLKID